MEDEVTTLHNARKCNFNYFITKAHHRGKGLQASPFSGQRNRTRCSIFICRAVHDMFKTTITVETLLLQATNVDPKENLHNSAQGASWFNLLDCFCYVVCSYEAWSLALKAELNDKNFETKSRGKHSALSEINWRMETVI